MTKMIKSFSGSYRFLSNFYPCRIEYEGLVYPSTEAAYQAAKTLDKKLRIAFTTMKPGDAKRAGRKLVIRSDWEEVKLKVMYDLLKLKFAQPRFAELLLLTSKHELVEGNTWDDTYYGVCKGVGQNHLGKLLMKVRQELNDNISDNK